MQSFCILRIKYESFMWFNLYIYFQNEKETIITYEEETLHTIICLY